MSHWDLIVVGAGAVGSAALRAASEAGARVLCLELHTPANTHGSSHGKPLFIGGTGVGFSSCTDCLGRLIDKTGMPFILLNHGRGTLPDTHPLSIWDCGNVGIMVTVSQADVIVVAGIRLNWLLQSGSIIPATTKVVRIDIDPHEIDRNRQADAGLVGDCGSVLGQLDPLLKKKEHREWVTMLRAASQSMIDGELKVRRIASDPIHPIRLAAQIQSFLGDDALYASLTAATLLISDSWGSCPDIRPA